MPGILSLDIATTTGAAFALPGERPTWRHRRFGKPGDDDGAIGSQFQGWLLDLIEPPEWVIFESPFIPRGSISVSNATIRRLYGLAMVAQMVAHSWGAKCREVDTASVAKHFTGQARWGGRAAKKAATLRVCARYGWSPVTEDEADALAVLIYAEALIDPMAAARRGVGPLLIQAG